MKKNLNTVKEAVELLTAQTGKNWSAHSREHSVAGSKGEANQKVELCFLFAGLSPPTLRLRLNARPQ
jgi:hypothetical protein